MEISSLLHFHLVLEKILLFFTQNFFQLRDAGL